MAMQCYSKTPTLFQGWVSLPCGRKGTVHFAGLRPATCCGSRMHPCASAVRQTTLLSNTCKTSQNPKPTHQAAEPHRHYWGAVPSYITDSSSATLALYRFAATLGCYADPEHTSKPSQMSNKLLDTTGNCMQIHTT